MASQLPSRVFLTSPTGTLFKWIEEVDKFPEGIVYIENILLYHSLAVEHPGVVLGRDQPLPSIEEELVPQGRAEDTAACNANLQPFDIAGVAAAPIIHANTDKLDKYEIDDDDGIVASGDIPQQPPHAPLVVNDTDNNNNATGSGDDDDDNEDVDEDKDNDNSLDEDEDDNEPAAATDALEGNESDGNQGA